MMAHLVRSERFRYWSVPCCSVLVLLIAAPSSALALIDDPASGEADTELATLGDNVLRATGRALGARFEDYHQNESLSVGAGGLLVRHPSAPTLPLNGSALIELMRSYSSKLCRQDVYTRKWWDDDGQHIKRAHVWRGESWAGYGWSFHLGRISYLSEKVDPNQKDYENTLHFVEPDGTSHRLYSVGTDEWGTGDGSYIRALLEPGDIYRVLYPDGRWLRLAKVAAPTIERIGPTGNKDDIVTDPDTHGYYTTAAGSGARTHYTVQYQMADGYGHPEGIRRIEDAADSARFIDFEVYADPNRDPNQVGVAPALYGTLRSISVPVFGGGRVSYSFQYTLYPTDPNRPPEETFPLLTRVDLPEGYALTYEYETLAFAPHLKRLTYPGGGSTEYTYRDFSYLRPGSAVGSAIGVTRRRVFDGAGRSFSWFYKRANVSTPEGGRQEVVVTDPHGNATKYLFYAETSDAAQAVLYGRLREVTTYQGNTSGSLISRVEQEPRFMCSSSPKAVNYGTDTVLEADVRTVQVKRESFDPGSSTPVTELVVSHLDWNGLGRFYRTMVSGSAIKTVKETFTRWTADPNVTDPWILHEYSYRAVTEGSATSREDATFDVEGRLVQQRVYRDILNVDLDGGVSINLTCQGCGTPSCPRCPPPPPPPPPPPSCPANPTFPDPNEPLTPGLHATQDLIAEFVFDPFTGNLQTRRSKLSTTDAIPNWNDPVETNYDYENAAPSRVSVTGVPYDIQTAARDQTGLPESVTGADGVHTSFAYDALGRLTQASPGPDQEDPTRILYAPASAGAQYTLTLRGGPATTQFDPTAPDQAYTKESYDGLGRTVRVEQAMPGGELVVRETAYSPTGEPVFVSEWIPAEDLAAAPRQRYERTQPDPDNDPNLPDDLWFIDLPLDPNGRIWGTRLFYGVEQGTTGNPLSVARDPLERIHRVKAADGATAEASYAARSRTVTARGAKVKTASSGLGDPNTADVSTTYWEDGEGRLLMVDSPAGAADAVYGYDVHGRIARVNLLGQLPGNPWDNYGAALADPNGQSRWFLYDGVGRLVETVSPEAGKIRNDLFDVRGQPVKIQEERGRSRGYYFEMSYDALGRPTKAERIAASSILPWELLVTFASGIPGSWTKTADSGTSTWHAYGSLVGESCSGFSDADHANAPRVGAAPCVYGGGPQGRDELISPSVGAPSNNVISGMTVLTFNYLRETRDTSRDADTTRLDRMYVEVEDQTNGGTRKRVFYADSETAAGVRWLKSPEIDLSEFKGHVIRLHFVFERTDDAGGTTGAGWSIDDVKVTTKARETLWERSYDQAWCSGPPAGILADLCWFDLNAAAERPLGKLSAITSYQDGAMVQKEFFTYRGMNGRMSAWGHRLDWDRDGSVFDDFVARLRYDDLGQVIGVRAPQRVTERARDYQPSYDRGFLVGLGDNTDDFVPSSSSVILESVGYNPAGGVSQVVFGTGPLETVDFDIMSRPRRMRLHARSAPDDDFNNCRGAWCPVVFDTGDYEYDGAGNIMKIGADDFIYDEAMRLLGAQVQGHPIDYTYDPFGNMTSRDMPQDEIAAMEFGPRSYTPPLPAPQVPDNRIHDPDFVYDENGNLLGEPEDSLGPITEPAKRYDFDALNRLREVWVEGTGGFIPVSRMTYDAGGMRVIKEDATKAGRVTYYLRDTGGDVRAEYVVERGTLEAPYRSKEYIYGMGRALGVNDFCGPPPYLRFDDPNSVPGAWRFVAEVPTGLAGVSGYRLEIAAFGFGLPRIIAVSVDPNGRFEVPTSEFAQSGVNYMRLRAVAACGETVWSNELQMSLDGSGPPEGSPPKSFDLAEISLFHVDHLGSVRVETDQLGVLRYRRDYYPFGREIAAVGGDNTHRFTGHDRDLETGMDYMRARHYGSGLARFLGADPMYDSALVSPQSWNVYGYVRNRPVLFTDPSGMVTLATLWAFEGIPAWAYYGFWINVLNAGNEPIRGGYVEQVTVYAEAPPPDTPVPPSHPCFSVETRDPCFYAEMPYARRFPAFTRSLLATPWQLSGVGPAFGPFAFNATWIPETGDLWVAGGVGLSTLPEGYSFGPLFMGDMAPLDQILSGWGWGVDVQYGAGLQFNGNVAGTVGGFTGGVPALSISYTYGARFSAPPIRFQSN